MVKKGQLRKLYLEKRANLPEQDYQLRNQQMAQHFFDFFSFRPGQHVHCFLPIPNKKEPDTWPIIYNLQRQAVNIVVSKSDLDNNILYHYPLTSKTVFQANRWGIPEPVKESEAFPVEKIDAVIIPLLAFDQYGHRVGYGKGYYDRFLIQCRPDTQKIGLSLEPPVAKIEDMDEQLDVRLNYCVTPDQVWSFKP